MRPLVREGAWVFIVIGVNPFSLEQKSFPYRSLLGRILWDPFHIGIPLRFHKTWRASHLFIHANVVSKHSLTSAVSFILCLRSSSRQLQDHPSALLYRQPMGASPYNFILLSIIKQGLTAQQIPSPINRRLILINLFYPYQLPPIPYLRHFSY